MNLIGICGDNCQSCPRYTATTNNSLAELERVKDLWVRLGLRDNIFPVQDMICHGCRPENRCAYPELYACVKTKDLENCGLCDNYPCELLTTAFEKSEQLKTRALDVCTSEELVSLQKAFFSKKEYFDTIHYKIKNER
jgi:hypothetical protein